MTTTLNGTSTQRKPPGRRWSRTQNDRAAPHDAARSGTDHRRAAALGSAKNSAIGATAAAAAAAAGYAGDVAAHTSHGSAHASATRSRTGLMAGFTDGGEDATSATPSLESLANAARGKYRLLRLPGRVDARPLPAVRVVDLRRDVAGGVVPGVLVLKPDYPENMDDWPFLWGENEYVIDIGASYIFLANAAQELLAR